MLIWLEAETARRRKWQNLRWKLNSSCSAIPAQLDFAVSRGGRENSHRRFARSNWSDQNRDDDDFAQILEDCDPLLEKKKRIGSTFNLKCLAFLPAGCGLISGHHAPSSHLQFQWALPHQPATVSQRLFCDHENNNCRLIGTECLPQPFVPMPTA